MKKIVLFTSVAAMSLVSGIAGAATLHNTDKESATVHVDVAGKKDTITLKSGESYDSKGLDASFIIGKEKAISAKGSDKLIVKGGKIEAEKLDTAATVKVEVPATAKVDTSTTVKTVAPEAPKTGQ